MEQEKYLKPHFSKTLTPLINFMFHNSEYYNIPDEIKYDKSGPFKFPEHILHSPGENSSSNINIESHLGHDKLAHKLKIAVKSAK